MESRIPGLGGVFLDRSSGRVTVYLRDMEHRDAALQELRALAPSLNVDAAFRAKLGTEDATKIIPGQYGFSELVAWQQEISRVVREPGFLSIDADEALNRVRVTIAEDAAPERFMRAIAAAGIPDSAVVIDTSPLIVSLASVRDRIRPTAGGLQISNALSTLCTLGFNVDVQFYGQKGFLTASHCDSGTRGGGGTGNSIYQNTVSLSNTIGIVSINPAWTRTDFECRGYTLCTLADVMYVEAVNYSASEWAKKVVKASYAGINNAPGSLTISSYWTGLSIAPFTYVGASVDKVGRTSGLTRGKIGATCENPLVDSLKVAPYVVLCSERVDSAAAGEGDSGAPVYYPEFSPDPTYAIGIVFASTGSSFGTDGICTAGCRYYYSPWYSIETHLSRYFTP